MIVQAKSGVNMPSKNKKKVSDNKYKKKQLEPIEPNNIEISSTKGNEIEELETKETILEEAIEIYHEEESYKLFNYFEKISEEKIIDQNRLLRKGIFSVISLLVSGAQIASFLTLIADETKDKNKTKTTIDFASAIMANGLFSSMVMYYFLLDIYVFIRLNNEEISLTKGKSFLLMKSMLLLLTFVLGGGATIPYLGMSGYLLWATVILPSRAAENTQGLLGFTNLLYKKSLYWVRTPLERAFSFLNEPTLSELGLSLTHAKMNLIYEKPNKIANYDRVLKLFKEYKELILKQSGDREKNQTRKFAELWLEILKNGKDKTPYPQSTIFKILKNGIYQNFIAGFALGVGGISGYFVATYQSITKNNNLNFKIDNPYVALTLTIFAALPFSMLIFGFASQYVSEDIFRWVFRFYKNKRPDLPLSLKRKTFAGLQLLALGVSGFMAYGAQIVTSQLDHEMLPEGIIRDLSVTLSEIGTRFLYPWVGITVSMSLMNVLIRFKADKELATQASLNNWLEEMQAFIIGNAGRFSGFNDVMHSLLIIYHALAEEEKDSLTIIINNKEENQILEKGYILNSKNQLFYFDNCIPTEVNVNEVPGLYEKLIKAQSDAEKIAVIRHEHSNIFLYQIFPIITGSLNSSATMTVKVFKEKVLKAFVKYSVIGKEHPETAFITQLESKSSSDAFVPQENTEDKKPKFENFSPLELYEKLAFLGKRELEEKQAKEITQGKKWKKNYEKNSRYNFLSFLGPKPTTTASKVELIISN